MVKITYHKADNLETLYTITSKTLYQDFILILLNMGFLVDCVEKLQDANPTPSAQA